jgi:hypothetical protein
VPRSSRIESVFLNIPYDDAFENLYLAYIVGLTQLGLRINATLAIPNQGRLEAIMDLIEQSNFSIHDLSRIELSTRRTRRPDNSSVAQYITDQGEDLRPPMQRACSILALASEGSK